jgi:ribonuclease VapC
VIAIDTSALMAIVLDEPMAVACAERIEIASAVVVSAGTLAEAEIVAGTRRVGEVLAKLLEEIELDIVPVTADTARRVGETYLQWGRGFHPAGLNFGDCFAYATAKERGCPLLYVGNDFGKTDIASALSV